MLGRVIQPQADSREWLVSFRTYQELIYRRKQVVTDRSVFRTVMCKGARAYSFENHRRGIEVSFRFDPSDEHRVDVEVLVGVAQHYHAGLCLP